MNALKILKLAWRNLGRNLRRTLITISAISFSLALLVVSATFGDGFHEAMIHQGVSLLAGHVVVEAQGYQKQPEVEKVVPRSPSVEARVAQVVPGAVVVPRIFLQGLLTSPANSVGVQITGVDPKLEAEVNDFHTKVFKGTYLEPDDDRGIVIGKTLAETLQVGLGDKVVLMAQRKGQIESRLFRVRGIFLTGSDEMDAFYAQVPLKAAQQALGLGAGVNQISVHLKDPDETHAATRKIAAALSGAPLEILPWQRALPELHQFVVIDNGSLYVIVLVIALIVALGILNTILMSVLERRHEFGVLLALGMSPGRLAAMVLTESFLIGLLAAALGAGFGALLSWPLVAHGVDFSKMMGQGANAAGVSVAGIVHGDLSGFKLALFSSLACVITVVSALYPTWKAARLKPVQAMHQH